MGRRVIRSGSVLALLLVIMGALASLLLIEQVWWQRLQDDVEDSTERLILQNHAISVLETVTAWLYDERPGSPLANTDSVLELNASDGPDRLEISIPLGVVPDVPAGFAVSVRVQWCLYRRTVGLPETHAADWPPSLAEESMSERAVTQSYAQTRSDAPLAANRPRRAWRLRVTCASHSDDAQKVRSATVERVVVLE